MKISNLTWRCFLYVEPVLFLYACGFFMSMPIQKQFIYYRYSEDVGFPYDLDGEGNTGCGAMEDVKNTTLKNLENKVQKLASNFDSLIIPVLFLPSTIMGLFIGPWTDTVGRKPALLLSTLGAALESLMVIGIMSFRWPLRLLLLGKVLNGMTGFLSSMAQAAFVYVSDSTDKSHIPTRL
ncbi:hypothetical protein QZH41_012270, partial [Actinostola sp. cb2023]